MGKIEVKSPTLFEILYKNNSRAYKGCLILSIIIMAIMTTIASVIIQNSKLPNYAPIVIALYSFFTTSGLGNIYEYISSYNDFNEVQDKKEKRKLVFVGTIENIVMITVILVMLIPSILLRILLVIVALGYVVLLIWAWLNRDEKVRSRNTDTENIEKNIKNYIKDLNASDDYKLNIYQVNEEVHVYYQEKEGSIILKYKR
ncbi:hypothetical protein [Staphylococcus hominis]